MGVVRRVLARVWTGCLVVSCLTWASPGLARAADSGWVAVVGDFGNASSAERSVATLVDQRQPIAVVTTGDNAYGGRSYPEAVGAFYCRYIAQAPDSPSCPATSMATVNAFFPSPGNHDYAEAGVDAFRSYFVAARARTTYAVTRGGIEFFILDSQRALDDPRSMADQRAWLKSRLQASTAPWQVVVLHHPPYSSAAVHGSTEELRWPFRQWGADLVIAGHDHDYERIQRWGLTYLVDGSGGADLYGFGRPLMGSLVRNATDHGAVFLRVEQGSLVGEFRSTAGTRIDRFVLTPRR